ncbi:hypothetical protein B0T25DRAFT_320455 [Lasiosphaeria hispida]|uniref:Lytic polysaccharide monooxygenase n=1 Tax=Lasiosphaeria hispida TaxID=260671 RepID=A0AAJ0H9E0_9PEZI|nr:hypothetical protein B0T25DRAFT_320455 [Lasiosphaeria hispida]
MPSLYSVTTSLLAGLLAGGQLVSAHMEMSFPPPFRSKFNPHATNIDYSMTAPLSGDGSNFPCKGYQSDLGTPAGASTATFAPGSTHNMTITGGAAHGGGSCQAALSYDGGKTFTVIKSIVGGCPLSSNYDFTIPDDAQGGNALFAWTWYNELGNREFYMNCAPITIGGGAARRDNSKRAAAFSARPSLFLANIGNGCTTVESADVAFPDPGPDVTDNGGKQAPPSGSCGASAAPAAPDTGSGSGSGGQAPPSAPPAAPPAAPPVAPPAAPPAAPPTTVAAPSPTGPPPQGGIFITIPTGSETAAPEPTASATKPSTTVEAPQPAPTTLQTATKTAPANAPVGTSSGSSSGSNVAGTACSNEGAWNCIGGTAFQRCASGQWSATIPMAAGTSCSPGTSDTLVMAGRRSIRHLRHLAF